MLSNNFIIQNHCNTIYELAKNQNKNELIQKEYEKQCLGEYFGVYNAVMLLAKDNCVEAVNFLINSFKANLNDAIQGYAWGRNELEVENLLKAGVSIRYALRGYALGQHHDRVYRILGTYPDLINEAILGYAKGGHDNQVNELLTHSEANLNFVLQGYGQGGYIDQVNLWLSQDNVEQAILGCAKGGHIKEINKLLKKYIKKNLTSDFYRISQQYNDTLVHYAISGYASGGHVKEVTHLSPDGCEHAILGYAAGGYINEVNALLVKVNGHDLRLHFSARTGYMNSNFFNVENRLRLLAYTNDEHLRKILINSIDYLDYQQRSKAYQMQGLNQIIQLYKVNFIQAKAIKKLKSSGRAWLSLGSDIILKAHLPLEIFIIISYFLTGLTNQKDIHDIFHAINERNTERALEKNHVKYQTGLPFKMFYNNILAIQQFYTESKLQYNQKFSIK